MCFNLSLNYFHVPPWHERILRTTHNLEGTLTTLSLYTGLFLLCWHETKLHAFPLGIYSAKLISEVKILRTSVLYR